MFRFIFILISIFVVGFFIVKDTWMVSIQGFGYELKASVLILIVGAILFLYLLHLLKKPFGWWGRCQNWFAKNLNKLLRNRSAKSIPNATSKYNSHIHFAVPHQS